MQHAATTWQQYEVSLMMCDKRRSQEETCMMKEFVFWYLLLLLFIIVIYYLFDIFHNSLKGDAISTTYGIDKDIIIYVPNCCSFWLSFRELWSFVFWLKKACVQANGCIFSSKNFIFSGLLSIMVFWTDKGSKAIWA